FYILIYICIFFFQAEDGIRDRNVTGVQTCALPISTSIDALTIYIKSFSSCWSSSKIPLVVAIPPGITSTVTSPKGINYFISSLFNWSETFGTATFTVVFILLISPLGI